MRANTLCLRLVLVALALFAGSHLGTSTTDALGNYISGPGLTGGSYYVRTSNSIGYINELDSNVPCGSSCSLAAGTAVAVETGATTPGINFALALGGTVSGQVTSGATPLANVSVQIVNAATNAMTSPIVRMTSYGLSATVKIE